MHLRTLLTITLLVLAPAYAVAQPEGCSHGDRTEAMSCLQGFVWDDETGTCIEQATS